MNFSIRELLIVVTFFALAVGAILTGPPVSWIALAAFTILWLTKLIDSLVRSGNRRHFAVGFSVVAAVYLALCVYLGDSEFQDKSNRLPSTALITEYMKPDYVPGTSSRDDLLTRRRNAKSVYPLGHLAIACAAGYIGGWYSRFTASDRNRTQPIG